MKTPVYMPVARQGRVTRRPQHTFHLRTKPFQIQPFAIAPVLPGETMRNALLQVRAVTSPIKNPLIGWWMEHYIFYVKHRDLQVDWTEDLVLNPDFDFSDHDVAGADAKMYAKANHLPWVELCLQRVTEEYFRNEGETWNGNTIDGLPAASVQHNSWMDSMWEGSPIPDDVEIPVNADDADGHVLASDVDASMRQWEFMRANGLTTMDYEDFLATYGIRPAPELSHVPELIRYSRSWQYPSNTVEPTTGVPSSAVSWAIAERADKDRFFREPGFIFGVTVARPKVYFSGQDASAVHMLTTPFSWLPAIMNADPYTSLKEFGNANGPLTGQTDGYWVDVRDLFMYGDQFVNFGVAETDAGMVALPQDGLQRRFPSLTDVNALFTGGEGVPTDVRQDGVLNLTIAGTQRDNTPTSGLSV